jgi:hypothetical protein
VLLRSSRSVPCQTPRIDDALQRLLDEQAIRRLLVDYCRGVDRGDEALVASVYHPDATDDHGRFKGTGFEFAAYAVSRLTERYQGTMHSITNTVIDFAGPDLAHVESHVCARHWREDDDGSWMETFGGRYVDRFERRDGAWKIADRVVVHEWSTLEPVTAAFPAERFVQGRRDGDDASYQGRERA